MLRHRARVLGKYGGIVHDALLQAHAVPVFEINGRNDQHARCGQIEEDRGGWS
jgi:hypothetical protein